MSDLTEAITVDRGGRRYELPRRSGARSVRDRPGTNRIVILAEALVVRGTPGCFGGGSAPTTSCPSRVDSVVVMDTGELLLEVEPGGAAARVVDRTTLGDAGLLERRHLQEWIVAHPEILGPTVMVVTIEYAGWIVDGDPQRQRLDVLGIDADGRLVVAELKRGLAPDTVDMQAVKYAAMASRFSLETLAAAHATFCKSRGVTLSEDQAAEALQAHAAALSDDTLNDPRIVIVAQGYSPLVISTVVWLADRGVDISLVQFQPYKRSTGEVLVTFSTLFPLPDLERSLISPGEAAAEVPTNKLPFVEWTTEDLVKLGQIANLTTRSTLDLCSEQPGVPVSLTRVVDAASVTRFAARAQLAGLTQIVKRRFGRRNWPFTVKWDVDGTGQQFYVITEEVATLWHAAAIELDTEQSDVVVDASSNGSSPFTTGEDTVVPN